MTPFKVVLYSLAGDATTEVSLLKTCEWNHNYAVTSLVAHGHRITIGDIIVSVSILEVVGTKIISIARDYGPLWPIAVEALPGHGGVIGGNVSASSAIYDFFMVSWLRSSNT